MKLRRRAAVVLLVLLSGCAHSRPAAESSTLRIYLARHGQTDWNLARRLQGLTDTDLNETGRAQARTLGSRLEGVKIDQVYSSALRRSRETAAIAEPEVKLESLPALNEHGLGKFEGLYRDGRDSATEAEYQRRSADEDDSLDGGESMRQFTARVCGAVEQIRREHPGGSVLIVGHGGTNAAILRCVFSLSAGQTSAIQQSNDELYLIEIPGPQPPKLWKLIPADKLGEL